MTITTGTFGMSFSYMELAMVFVFVLVVFGPRKLPEILRTAGKVMRQLRSASNEFKQQIMEVETVVRDEVREFERSIESEMDEVKADLDYSFEDDPYHADMEDDDYHKYHDEHGNPIDPDAVPETSAEEDLARAGLEAAVNAGGGDGTAAAESGDDGADAAAGGREAEGDRDIDGDGPDALPGGVVATEAPRAVAEAEIPDFLKLERGPARAFLRLLTRHGRTRHRNGAPCPSSSIWRNCARCSSVPVGRWWSAWR